MIRLFPYSFLAIELQGNGFDNPNRLFFSIEDTFYNISSQKSDLRELIPEFFYLPEMFINFNSINFHKRSNGDLVNDVIMPKNISLNINHNLINSNENYIFINKNEDEITKYCIFVDDMKNKLENLKYKLNFWIDIIFGKNQKYKNNKKKDQQFFRSESYIDVDNKTSEKYSSDEFIMNSLEFGLIPLQTIYDYKIFENKSYNYNKIDENTKSDIIFQKNKRKSTYIKDKNNKQNIELKISEDKKDIYLYKGYKNFDKNYLWEQNLNIDFRIDKSDNFGKLKIYNNNRLAYELIDHNDKIIDIFYNQRLNMFATTSKDGLACIYLIPNKLFSIIKHPNNLCFNKIFLSSNPFPSIITFEENKNILKSYSLSGIIIKEKKISKNENKIEIIPFFNKSGGILKDKLGIYDEENQIIILYNLPFFDEDHII